MLPCFVIAWKVRFDGMYWKRGDVEGFDCTFGGSSGEGIAAKCSYDFFIRERIFLPYCAVTVNLE